MLNIDGVNLIFVRLLWVLNGGEVMVWLMRHWIIFVSMISLSSSLKSLVMSGGDEIYGLVVSFSSSSLHGISS